MYGGSATDYVNAPQWLVDALIRNMGDVEARRAKWTAIAIAACLGSKEAADALEHAPSAETLPPPSIEETRMLLALAGIPFSEVKQDG